jgi:phosphoenolpyruvate carboxykinase (GTP)
MRVLKWIVERVEGKAGAKATALGNVPESLDMAGLETFGPDKFAQATAVDKSQWHDEMKLHGELLDQKLGDHVPGELKKRYSELKSQFA